MNQSVCYSHSSVMWKNREKILHELSRLQGVKNICDIGGGANPALDLSFINQNQLNYTLLDISSEELKKTSSSYKKICADISDQKFQIDKQFDLVFSMMVAEHIKDPKYFHTNVYNMLSPQGIAIHFFPTLYAPPFVVNKYVTNRISDILLDIFLPRNRYQHEKFSAYYHWCFGPTKNNFLHFESVGYHIVKYVGYFGHSYYCRVPIMDKLQKHFTKLLLTRPNPNFTSYACVLLSKSESCIINQDEKFDYLQKIFVEMI